MNCEARREFSGDSGAAIVSECGDKVENFSAARQCNGYKSACHLPRMPRVAPRLGMLVLFAALPCWGTPQSAQPSATGQPQPAQVRPQTSSPAGRRLNLAAALDLASRQNLDLAAARLQHSVAEAGIRTAGQIPNPGVSVSVTRDTPHESLLFDLPVEIGGQRGRRIDVARQEIALTDVDIRTLESEVRLKTREAFYTAVLARSRTTQLQESLGLAERLQEIAKTRFEAGDVPQLEVFEAGLQVSRAQADVQVASQQESIAFSALNELLNEPAETLWDLSGSLEDLPGDVHLKDLMLRAGSANADLLHLLQEMKVEQGRRALLRAERIPTPDVTAGTYLNSPPDYRVAAVGTITVGIPLFSRNQGEIAQSEASERMLNASLAATQRAVNGRVEQAYYAFYSRQTEVNLYATQCFLRGGKSRLCRKRAIARGRRVFSPCSMRKETCSSLSETTWAACSSCSLLLPNWNKS